MLQSEKKTPLYLLTCHEVKCIIFIKHTTFNFPFFSSLTVNIYCLQEPRVTVSCQVHQGATTSVIGVTHQTVRLAMTDKCLLNEAHPPWKSDPFLIMAAGFW